eukprot:c19485_g1_i2.p1 GENE.c19485_g1_i2~~c19485_g1_i2.p1  ORF type:complete len:128 (-),score=23.87 c19485_g1_i2:22-405(-)
MLREVGAQRVLGLHSLVGPYNMSALIGLACLAEGDDLVDATHVCTELIEALKATLRGEDYPSGSRLFFKDWRLMIGICNLCNNRQNRTMLTKSGLVPVLGDILKTSKDTRLVATTLSTLWKLGFESQ